MEQSRREHREEINRPSQGKINIVYLVLHAEDLTSQLIHYDCLYSYTPFSPAKVRDAGYSFTWFKHFESVHLEAWSDSNTFVYAGRDYFKRARKLEHEEESSTIHPYNV
jgi:hypothetical protein